MTGFFIAVAAVYGLIVGSFVNAWAYRLAHGERITHGRSHCPTCGHVIRAHDNVPVVSWLVLRGRCRDCGARIGWRYPAGEALMCVLWVGVFLLDGVSWLLVPHLLFVSALVLVSQVDIEKQIIPDVVILPVAAVGLPLMIALGDSPWWQYPVAGAAAAGFFLVVREIYFRVRHQVGMGFGDVKLALCMGFYLGVTVVPGLFIGFVAGAVVGVLILALRRGDGKTAIPFGPFMAAGGVAALFAGGLLIDAYLALVFGG